MHRFVLASKAAVSGGLHAPAGRRGVRGFKVAICNLKERPRPASQVLPLAFTEHGAIMAATLLNSPRATELSVYVVRAFVELRGILLSNRELATKVYQLERKVSTHERNIAELADSMGQLLAAPAPPPKRAIGFLPVEEKGKPASKAAVGRKV